ncbi:hypothetical protein TNCV_417551 [Trichonephila clavipes]|nr:hypothetical protein TNCV_417551 [Trichonephila clavipes]
MEIDGNEEVYSLVRTANEEEMSPTGSLTSSEFPSLRILISIYKEELFLVLLGNSGEMQKANSGLYLGNIRLTSRRIKAITFCRDKKVFLKCHWWYSELVSPAHILTV